jgi:adenylate kinase
VNVLLLGPQGSGKGTQAKRISAEVGVPHISTGDMFREAIAVQTDLGRRVEPILERGDLVPDELTIELIRERLGRGDALRGFVLDGFPRTLAQAEALDVMLDEEGRQLDVVFDLQVSDRVARERLLIRAELENRPDDTPEAIDRRLALYHELTLPISEHYRARGILVGIHGERTPDEVFREIQHALRAVEARA